MKIKEFILIFAMAAALAAYIFGPGFLLQWRSSKLIGEPEAKVISFLGKPRVALSVAEVASLAPEDYPWDYGGKILPYPVTNKIFHYSERAGGVLIYINKEGKVEHFIGTDP